MSNVDTKFQVKCTNEVSPVFILVLCFCYYSSSLAADLMFSSAKDKHPKGQSSVHFIDKEIRVCFTGECDMS